MPPYQAQRQSLYGVGSPAFIRPQIDVGGAIQDLAGAGNSFIHQAFLRRQAENEMQLRRSEFGLQQQREARESAAQQRQLGIAERGNEIRAAMAGYQPAHTDVTEEAPAPAAAPAPAPSAAAQISGLPSQAGTTPLTRPANLGPVTKLDFNDVPASYDPTRAAPYVRSMGLLNARGDLQQTLQAQRLAAQQAGREYMGGVRTQIEQMRENFKKQNGGKEMTGGQKETMLQRAATGLIGQYNGSYDDASDALASTDEGKQLKALGVEPRHLMFAAEQFRSSATKEAVGLQRGAAGQSPEESTGSVAKTRSLIGGGGKKPAASAPPPAPNGGAPAPAAAPAPATAAPRPLNAREKATAKTDAGFATFLQSKGYKPKDWQ